MVFSPPRSLRGFVLSVAAAVVLLGCAQGAAHAQQKLDVAYRATLSGLTVGNGTLLLDLSQNRFSVSAKGRAAGLMRMFGGGDGEGAAQGSITGKKLITATYAHTIRTHKKVQSINMTLASGNVKQLEISPPLEPDNDRVPITDALKRGVVDPASAGIIPAAGANGVGPEACAQKIPVFDGRLRFDLTLAYKREESVHAEGYRGPAVVCRVTFEPLGGHDNGKAAIKYLRANREIELWFAPIAGTPFLALFRISLPTPLGPAVLQATRFAATAGSTRAGKLDARMQ